ncbi:WD repeat-containing protein 43 isoform X2 [Mangifera indica]|uniref:WD repeat-containing protein 43 isoform X2 n=1 Tax=Mangifera indica TaxID=29780 RepID=UPI001CFC1E3B|nr:WD repeat-containing protein 43 isoform X2 [Mangifera indica]
MAKQKLKSLMTSFTPDGEFFAVLSPNGVVKIWSTSDGTLLAEWKHPDGDTIVGYSCMACSFVGKKRRKERGTFLLALGTSEGEMLVIDAFSGETKWKSTGHHSGGVAALSFANRGRSLHVVGRRGMAFVMKSESGEVIREFGASEKPISCLAFSCDEKNVALASDGIRVLSMESGKEVLKCADNVGQVQYLSISDDAKTIVTSCSGEKHLQVWSFDFGSKSASSGPALSMRHPPLTIECKNSSNGEGGKVILAVSESGVAYIWNLNTDSKDEETNPTKITVKATKGDAHLQNGLNVKKTRTSVFSARLIGVEADGQVTALISYGSIDSPKFSLVNISNPGENIVITDGDTTKTVQENGIPTRKESDAVTTSAQSKKGNKKRAASDPDLAAARSDVDTGHGEDMDGVLVNDDLNELTMGEKLADLYLLDNDKSKSHETQDSSPAKPPSADSVNVLLKQALRADDRALLLECLYNQDKKVITNSISQLKPADVLKLLHSLVSIIQSRGAVLACALPWLKTLLLQHASGIMSQESSLLALNTLYQLIESRVSTFQSALQISSCLDFLYGGIVNEGLEENDAMIPVIYEDKDTDEEEESDDAMETDQNNEEKEYNREVDGTKDFEGTNDMSD